MPRRWHWILVVVLLLSAGTTARAGGGDACQVTWTEVFAAEGGSVVGDIEGDGDIDIVVAGGYQVTLYLNDGDATFVETVAVIKKGGCCGVGAALELVDFNGDGLLDLLAYVDPVGVTLNNGDGTFSHTKGVGPPEKILGDAVAGDMNGDGAIDVVKVFNYGEVAIFFNNGGGSFPASMSFSCTSGGYFEGRLALADLDDDGDLDVVHMNISNTLVQIGLNDGNGGCAESQEIDTGVCGSWSAAFGDLDGDLDMDIAVACSGVAMLPVVKAMSSCSGTRAKAASRSPRLWGSETGSPSASPSPISTAIRISTSC